MKQIFTTLIVLSISFQVNAQELTRNLTPKNQRFGCMIGYYGDKFSNSGVQLGAETYLATTQNYQVIASLNYNLFGQKDTYIAHNIIPRIGVRYTANFGLIAESYFGFGYIFRKFQYDQYWLNNNGNIVNRGKAGVSSAVPNIALGLGYDFMRKLKMPVRLYARPSISFFYPNGYVVFEATYAIETGIIYVPIFKTRK
ncbi:MAG: hypothetical protein Q8N05_03980 [Bacteroidota bacterium]|nr:hypothetical protein [Bacteroidota bacterium]